MRAPGAARQHRRRIRAAAPQSATATRSRARTSRRRRRLDAGVARRLAAARRIDHVRRSEASGEAALDIDDISFSPRRPAGHRRSRRHGPPLPSGTFTFNSAARRHVPLHRRRRRARAVHEPVHARRLRARHAHAAGVRGRRLRARSTRRPRRIAFIVASTASPTPTATASPTPPTTAPPTPTPTRPTPTRTASATRASCCRPATSRRSPGVTAVVRQISGEVFVKLPARTASASTGCAPVPGRRLHPAQGRRVGAGRLDRRRAQGRARA